MPVNLKNAVVEKNKRQVKGKDEYVKNWVETFTGNLNKIKSGGKLAENKAAYDQMKKKQAEKFPKCFISGRPLSNTFAIIVIDDKEHRINASMSQALKEILK